MTNKNGSSSNGDGERLPVLKTYKIYVGGKFPRTESGRFYQLKNGGGAAVANVCLCSRKDFRDAVVAARAAQNSWAARSAYNRGQILYRIAEMLEGRRDQFIGEMVTQGIAADSAGAEVATTIDRIVYYAGWVDKYTQVFGTVNPVASSHFNFSLPEPTGVVGVLAPSRSALIGLVSSVIPAVAGGNTVVALAAKDYPLSAVTLGEVLATSDLPGGVINLLTGDRAELAEHFASHMDVNAVIVAGGEASERTMIRTKAASNVKRVVVYGEQDWMEEAGQGPYFILDTQETKTTWHPVGV